MCSTDNHNCLPEENKHWGEALQQRGRRRRNARFVVDGLTFGHHAHDTVAVVAAIGALYGGGEGTSLQHECGAIFMVLKKRLRVLFKI